MHRIERSVLVPYSAARMFDLIADIDAYPRFLPSCSGAHQVPAGPDAVDATVEITYLGVKSRFTTRNRQRRPEQIDLELLDGPFRRLQGTWTLTSLGDAGCRVQLLLQYEFAGGPLGLAIAPVFGRLAGSLVDAFVREAEARHG